MMGNETCGRLGSKLCGLSEKISWLPPLIARVSVGWVFVEAGWGKLHNLEKVTEFFTSLGIPAAHLQAPFVASVELVCGALIMVGLFTRIASIPLICTMIVATLTAKRASIESLSDLFGLEDYLFIVILLWLVVEGAGCLSLDAKFCKKKAS